MEAEIDFEQPAFPQSPSLSSQSSVDDLIVEQKFQHKKKLICVGILLLAGLITAGVLVFGAHEATDGFDFNSNKVTADMVLPTTVITIDKLSSEHSYGTIQFAEYEMEFKWQSLYNKTHDYIKFEWNNDILTSDETSLYYNTYLNGVSGFMVDLQGDENSGDDLTTSPSYRNTSAIETLTFYIYKFDSNTPEEISISNDNTTITSEQQELLYSLINGYVGQYFSELSLKLGSLQFIGNEYLSINFIHNYAKFFYQNAADSGNSNWNFTILEEATELTNIIVLYNGTQIVIDPTTQDDDTASDGSSRRLLSDPECCPSPGHKSANPYSRCGNPKFGMCGRDTDCWSWVCGTCKCVDECHEHDWYCSCDSSWGFWCINVFWVGCSDQCWWQ